MQIPHFDNVRVLVAGDAMLDRYWYGDTRRVSPEAPVPVVHVARTADRGGGAANVALALRALGAGAVLLAVAGEDEAGHALTGLVREAGVIWPAALSSAEPTSTKLRVVSRHQQMLRLDFEGNPAHTAALGPAALSGYLDDADALILSDYGKGALAEPVALISAARERGVPVLVDPKRADFAAYEGATVITPNRAELERAVGPSRSTPDLIALGQEWLRGSTVEALLVTLGEAGMALITQDAQAVHVPARTQEVFDVTGAGDTVIATLGAALAAGTPLPAAAELANLAAGLVVGKLGTATVTAEELHVAARGGRKQAAAGVDEAELLELVAQARGAGERIVFTNGCFDLLHAGHVSFLQQARALGDRLLVAVNDDASVRRLKGQKRPINPLADRMVVLAGLACVDWVIAFGEDTPARLVEALAPEVLVKGDDYRPEEIAGADAVRAGGGVVRTLPLTAGYSTSSLIDRLHRSG